MFKPLNGLPCNLVLILPSCTAFFLENLKLLLTGLKNELAKI